MWVIAVAAVAGLTLFVLGTFLAARTLGIPVHAVQLGFGPGVRVRRADPEIRIGIVPGASIVFDPNEPISVLSRVPPGRTILLHLAGPALIFLVAAGFGGFPAAGRAALAVPGELLLLLSPLDEAAPALRRLAALDLPGTQLLSGTLARVAMFNLLPFPSTSGGRILAALIPVSERVQFRWLLLSVLGLTGLGISAIVAIVAWTLGG